MESVGEARDGIGERERDKEWDGWERPGMG
jgi:hypothetical protein